LSSDSSLDRQPDAALIARYVAVRDQEAFRELVRRHGPMVLCACARVLRHRQDAEDAFQAVFVILAARGRALRRVRSLGGWLHNVAVHVSYRALRGNRRRTLRLFAVQRQQTTAKDDHVRELQDVLDDELTALPAKYREAVILCDLEGHTREEAARMLNTSAGTVATWVARGRRRLRDRLVRRGVTLGAGGVAAAWSSSGAAAQLSAELVQQTLRHAELFLLTGTRVAGTAAAAKITSLAHGELNRMFLAKLSTTVGIVALALALVLGASPASQTLRLISRVHAAQVYLDDFEDGSATDGSPVTWATHPNFPFTTLNVFGGNLRVGNSVLGNNYGVVSVPAFTLSDTSIRAQVRIESQYDEAAAVFVRGNLNNLNAIAHTLEVEADGTLWFGIVGSFQLQSIESDLRPTQEDVILQLDAIGDTITGWAWRAGQPKPATPAFSRVNNQLSSGLTGVYYAPALTPRNPLGTAIFRYVQVATTSIPEPTSVALGSFGFFALAGFAIRTRLNRIG
jgi:RNA polymerase sigma factor (sigma-70 family)